MSSFRSCRGRLDTLGVVIAIRFTHQSFDAAKGSGIVVPAITTTVLLGAQRTALRRWPERGRRGDRGGERGEQKGVLLWLVHVGRSSEVFRKSEMCVNLVYTKARSQVTSPSSRLSKGESSTDQNSSDQTTVCHTFNRTATSLGMVARNFKKCRTLHNVITNPVLVAIPD